MSPGAGDAHLIAITRQLRCGLLVICPYIVQFIHTLYIVCILNAQFVLYDINTVEQVYS